MQEGLLLNGLHSTVMEYSSRATLLLQGQPDEATRADSLAFMSHLATSYLSSGLRISGQMYRSAATIQLGLYADWLVGFTVASIIALLVFYVFGYRPAILQMDKDMRRTRSMLLVFPDEVCALCARCC